MPHLSALLPHGAPLAALAVLALPAAASAGPTAKVVAYVPNWIPLPAFAATIDYGKITHINLAFENPTDDEGNLSFNPDDDALIGEAHKHHVPVSVSIGGGAASTDKTLLGRYASLLADDKRPAFVARLADYVTRHHFDGVDVDLEGPGIIPTYGAFVRDLAAALKPHKKLLTAAVSQGYGGDQVPGDVFPWLDWANVMAYDATGPWAPDRPGQHSSLDMAHSSVAYWRGRGLPKSKVVLGVPFYGYGFGAAFRNYAYPYSEIVASDPGAENADQAGTTIWYNGLATIRAKVQYVRDQGLAGVMIWSLDNDAPGDKSLLAAIDQTLHSPAKKDTP